MTKRLSLIALLLISLLTACKDDGADPYKCTECVDQPEANAANDNSGQGIYKGVLVGSSGTIKFDIANNGTSITAVLVIDGLSVTLTGNGTYSASTGFQGSFTGSLNGGTVIIPFSVTNTGTVSVSTPTIPGHSNVIIKIFKEKSTQLVEGFEGTFSGADSGTFNLVLIRNQSGAGEWIAIARSDSDSIFLGQVEDNGIFGGGGEIIIAGEISGDNIKGVWEHAANGANGAWTGKRTL
jgi:hypothetical protein